MAGEGIRSENYRPIHLEAIACEVPDLRMICAHLGVCWNKEAATLCRMCPNSTQIFPAGPTAGGRANRRSGSNKYSIGPLLTRKFYSAVMFMRMNWKQRLSISNTFFAA